MKSPVVLAYAGGIHASAAIPWLADRLGVEVVTVTLDVGQGHELSELRARALTCGAARAHVVDARDEFARDVLIPLLAGEPDATPFSSLPWPLIARRLTEIARIEGAGAVAHGSTDPAFDAGIRATDPSVTILAPAREWTMSDAELTDYVRARRLPVHASGAPDCRIDRHVWGRVIAWDGDEEPAALRPPAVRGRVSEPALVDIHFERGIPSSVNGVPMSPAELVECLALIGSQHGIGRRTSSSGPRHVLHDVPAATVLRAAASGLDQSGTGDVCLRLADGQYSVLSEADRHSLLVNYA
jgi:argininosuccinate synthase